MSFRGSGNPGSISKKLDARLRGHDGKNALIFQLFSFPSEQMQMKLADLKVLTLDCQATGANPQKGHLLEIGWVQTSAAATAKQMALTASAYRVALPADVDIPPAVQRVTGITLADAEQAVPTATAWRKLIRSSSTFTHRRDSRIPFRFISSVPMKLPSVCCPACRAEGCGRWPAISGTRSPGSAAAALMLLPQPRSGGMSLSNWLTNIMLPI
jgi:hypothetical protein